MTEVVVGGILNGVGISIGVLFGVEIESSSGIALLGERLAIDTA